MRGFSARHKKTHRITKNDYKYKTNININLKPKIIAKHLLANRLFIHKKMEQKVIINDYHNLKKTPINKAFEENIPPTEMIGLLKEYLPIHIGVGTVWNKNKVPEFEQTKRLKNACDDFRKKIIAFNFFGSIIFIMNGLPVVVRIYFDEEADEKQMEVSSSLIIDYKYEFQ